MTCHSRTRVILLSIIPLLFKRRHMNIDTTQTKNLTLKRLTRGLKWIILRPGLKDLYKKQCG